LELEIFEQKSEIIEGLLSCINCGNLYPIVSSIPFLIENLSSYFSIRTKLGGYLLICTKSPKIKSLIKKSLQKISHIGEDTSELEKNWISIYKKSKQTIFKTKIKNTIRLLPRCSVVIEHGCSIGAASEILAKYHGMIFGIDKSFFALVEAKKRKIQNADFFLADSLSHPFGKTQFDCVVALNVLELIEPSQLLQVVDSQAYKFAILSDPYDYERGKNSVKVRLDEMSVRKKLRQLGFKLIRNSNVPQFISWSLNVNSRLILRYKVDLIVASRK
jgi:hypothetical protein